MADQDPNAEANDWGAEGQDPAAKDGAQEWPANLDQNADPAEMDLDSSNRVLNQEEIDNLLGVNNPEDQHETLTGIRSIMNSSLVNYERLPMLEVVYDRLVRLMTTSLRNFTSDNVEVSLEEIKSIRFGDYLNSIPLPAMMAVFKAEEWDNSGLLTIDSPLIYSMVDVLLGGRQGSTAPRVEGRPYTSIERALVEKLVLVILNDISSAFDPLSPVTIRFDRLETNPRFASVSRPSNAAIVARLRLDMEERGGMIDLLFPYATLEPVRELLLQMFMGEKFGRDSIWESHLARELWQTEVLLEAVLDEQIISLREVLQMQEGSILRLNRSIDEDVLLRIGSKRLFLGQLGRKGYNKALRISKVLLHSHYNYAFYEDHNQSPPAAEEAATGDEAAEARP